VITKQYFYYFIAQCAPGEDPGVGGLGVPVNKRSCLREAEYFRHGGELRSLKPWTYSPLLYKKWTKGIYTGSFALMTLNRGCDHGPRPLDTRYRFAPAVVRPFGKSCILPPLKKKTSRLDPATDPGSLLPFPTPLFFPYSPFPLPPLGPLPLPLNPSGKSGERCKLSAAGFRRSLTATRILVHF